MSALFWLSYGVLWLVVTILVVLMILVYRQFGLMLMPGGARVSHGGLNLGARAPAVVVQFEPGHEVAHDWSPLVSGRSAGMKASFALFALPSCPLCARLLEDQEGLARVAQRYHEVQFLWVQGERDHAHEVQMPQEWTLARSFGSTAHDTMEVPGSPFAYLIGADSHILAKGLVNDPSDIDGLIAAAPRGVIDSGRLIDMNVQQVHPAPVETRP